MRKLIIKTASITLAVIIGVLAITFGALLLFSPKTLGGLATQSNNYPFAMYCYGLQYNKTKDIEDLGVIIKTVDAEKDSYKAEDYCRRMVEHDQFINYCNAKDEKSGADDNKNIMKEIDYVYSKYAISLVSIDRLSDMLTICRDYCSTKGYTKFNPFRSVIHSLADNLTISELNTIRNTINGLKSCYIISNDSEMLDNANTDINDIDYIISTKGE